MAVEYNCCEAGFFEHIVIIVVLVLFAGLMSGLTLGQMSLSLVDLEGREGKVPPGSDARHGAVRPGGDAAEVRGGAQRQDLPLLERRLPLLPLLHPCPSADHPEWRGDGGRGVHPRVHLIVGVLDGDGVSSVQRGGAGQHRQDLIWQHGLPHGKMDEERYAYAEGSVVNSSGMQLFTYSWSPKAAATRAVVCPCHGYAVECSVTMRRMAERLAREGYAIYSVDDEGHDRSSGLPGYLAGVVLAQTAAKANAKILPVVKNQHLLLCTLLICNAAAMEALPIFLDSLMTAWGAILISVTLILLFGEILPQSICSHYGLAIGASVTPLVRVLVWICFSIAYPISKLLDYVLGKAHTALFRRAELKTLVTLHGNEAGKGGELTHDETTIIAGALELTEKKTKDAMTTLCQTFAIDINANLDRDLMQKVLDKGHSRVPVYYEKKTNIIGLILVMVPSFFQDNDMILVVQDSANTTCILLNASVSEEMPLYDILNEFQKGHSHMAVVIRQTNPNYPAEPQTPTNDGGTLGELQGSSSFLVACQLHILTAFYVTILSFLSFFRMEQRGCHRY
ncbi:hypothetical protein ABZP36_018864 [Zizania latifolia]